jgi:hypothetical protein
MSHLSLLRLELGDHMAVGAVRVPREAALGDNMEGGVNPAGAAIPVRQNQPLPEFPQAKFIYPNCLRF